MGFQHWWVILILLVVVLIVWGPGKLPDVGAGLGRAIKEFRHATNEVRDSVNAPPSTPPSQPAAVAAPAPAPTPAPTPAAVPVEEKPAAPVPDDQRTA
jgi:sec-independent protein translocase protein TatA